MWTAAFLDLSHAEQGFIRAAGSLGWAVPAGIGAKLAVGRRPVLIFTGDGGFWYHCGELETAVRLGLDLVIVINNNHRLSQEREIYTAAYGGELTGNHHELWYFNEVNFAELARSMGAPGVRVEGASSIATALRDAFKEGGTWLVEVVTDPDAMAPLAYSGGQA
jgi:acetolactate synthase-1/2/3 large subunit